MRPLQRVAQLGVEVSRAGEGPTAQEPGFQVPVGPLEDALGLRAAGATLMHPDPGRARERLEVVGQPDLPTRHHPTVATRPLVSRTAIPKGARVGIPVDLPEA